MGLLETSMKMWGRQTRFSINETTDQLSYCQEAQLSYLENIFLVIITTVLLIPITKLLINTNIYKALAASAYDKWRGGGQAPSGPLPNQIIIIREYIP